MVIPTQAEMTAPRHREWRLVHDPVLEASGLGPWPCQRGPYWQPLLPWPWPVAGTVHMQYAVGAHNAFNVFVIMNLVKKANSVQ